MQRCNWCNNPINGGPFSNYCSKRCEKEAVANGEKKGVKYSTISILGVVIVIAFIIFKSNNSNSDQSKKENRTEDNYSTPNETVNNQSEKEYASPASPKNGDETATQNITEQEIVSDESADDNTIQEMELQNETTENVEDIVISLLKNGKSVREVADSTGLSRSEVRKIKRSIK